MGKIKLTKGALKSQRDALRRYERYLPILLLKKQQLQLEILRQFSLLEDRKAKEGDNAGSARAWAGLLTDDSVDIKSWARPEKVIRTTKNIAGIDFPVFERAEFKRPAYDLFTMPLWVDAALEALQTLISLKEEIKTLEEGIDLLRRELRITAQRVNLFEKIKIPESEEAIRVIKIFIGDQMANAVGRSKIAKRKISEEFAGKTA